MKMNLIEKNNRPREKMINQGSYCLTDAELLAIMLGSGTKDESILDLSERLVNKYGLKELFNMDYNDLIKISGIKDAKATKLLATFEIARRAMKNENKKIILDKAEAVFEYIRDDYILLNEEILTVIYVSSALRVIHKDKFTNFEPTLVHVPYKRIVNNAINKKAHGVFLVHNHPEGNIIPSRADIEVLDELKSILKPLGIHLLDSIIVYGDRFYSISESISNSNPFKQLKLKIK